jgi:hypothetical protein
MRYLAAALAALLISVPAMAVAGGPDALAIAKRALRLAEQPRPEIKQIYSAAWKGGSDIQRLVVRCPRGMVAAAITAETRTLSESVSGRRAFATKQRDPGLGFGPGPDGITVTCIRGRLVTP